MTAVLRALAAGLIAAALAGIMLRHQEPAAPSPGVQSPAATVVPDGKTLFTDKGCAYCHGKDANGTEKGPSLLGIRSRWSRERIEQQIREGGGAMPAFGAVLDDAEIKNLIDYLQSLKLPPKHARKRGSA